MAKTVSLKYDFEPYRCCEVKIGGTWDRVTARQFRSFDGQRRISCGVSEEKDNFLFSPTHQCALNSWEGTKETEANKFTIPLTATAAEMGAALRRCLGLCTSKFDPPKDV